MSYEVASMAADVHLVGEYGVTLQAWLDRYVLLITKTLNAQGTFFVPRDIFLERAHL